MTEGGTGFLVLQRPDETVSIPEPDSGLRWLVAEDLEVAGGNEGMRDTPSPLLYQDVDVLEA